MNRKNLLYILYFAFFTFLLMLIGCSTKPVLEMPETLPNIVKAYSHITIAPWNTGLVNTKVHVEKGDLFTIFSDEIFNRVYLLVQIEGKYIPHHYYFTESPESGKMYVKNPYSEWHQTSLNFDVIIWKSKDWDQITGFLQKMKGRIKQPDQINIALEHVRRLKKIDLAETKTSQEIEETKKELSALKEKMDKQEEEKSILTPQEDLQTGGPSIIAEHPDEQEIALSKDLAQKQYKEERISELELKLQNLTENLRQLQEEKRKWEEERKKHVVLKKELMEKTKLPPVIVIASPMDKAQVDVNIIQISGVVEDDGDLVRFEILVNGKPLKDEYGRGIKPIEMKIPGRLDFQEKIPLKSGVNEIRIRATDTDGLSSEKRLTVHLEDRRKNIWAVVIGINDYPNVRRLKYAINDVNAFHNYLKDYLGIPDENIFQLLDSDATKRQIESVLGTKIRRKVGKDDMVIIFYAGHGAIETDPVDPDGDGYEKYLLPYDADLDDLYSTSISMKDISTIFQRILAERIIFIADTCYSGASGGRTILAAKSRSTLSERFFERVSEGKGRVILSACSANEISKEDDNLKHGIFSYYLLEGLKGNADKDSDGIITVSELFSYLSKKVPEASGQDQHPVRKGETEGELVVGRVK